MALLYKWIFNANYGVFNTILIRLGFCRKNQAWLSTGSAFVILAIVCIWKGYALIMVNVMAGLQSVPEDIYEAAKLDGAKPVQTFFKITLPMIRPVISTASFWIQCGGSNITLLLNCLQMVAQEVPLPQSVFPYIKKRLHSIIMNCSSRRWYCLCYLLAD